MKICECHDEDYRHELKYYISIEEACLLRKRLFQLLYPDPHSDEFGKYNIASVYFDNMDNRSLKASLLGLSRRKKYRIRAYNGDDSFISLEKKEKRGDLSRKIACRIDRDLYDNIMYGNYEPLLQLHTPPAEEFYYELRCNGYRPKTVVAYERQVFLHPVSDVRITLDTKIRASTTSLDIFDGAGTFAPVLPQHLILLEVKYDHFLPDYIAALLPTNAAPRLSNSKYMFGRSYR